MRRFRRPVAITVGDRALEDFHVRAATQRDRAIAAESRDWLLLKSVLQPGERPRARVAVRFPHEGNAAGFAFVTDQRVLFEARERVTAVALPFIVFAGRPAEPSLGDFVITARTPGGPSGGEYTTTMRVRDAAAFHDFFPTLLDAARATGALPQVDTSWSGEVAAPVPAPQPESLEPLPPDLVDRALARFMEDGERIVFAAELASETGAPVTVLVTQRRLVVVESRLIWASPLERTSLIDDAGPASAVGLLAEKVTDSLVLEGGLATVGPGQRRLVLRPRSDPAAGVQLREHLRGRGVALLGAWPPAE